MIKEVENSGGDRDDIVQILERLGRIAAQRRYWEYGNYTTS